MISIVYLYIWCLLHTYHRALRIANLSVSLQSLSSQSHICVYMACAYIHTYTRRFLLFVWLHFSRVGANMDYVTTDSVFLCVCGCLACECMKVPSMGRWINGFTHRPASEAKANDAEVLGIETHACIFAVRSFITLPGAMHWKMTAVQVATCVGIKNHILLSEALESTWLWVRIYIHNVEVPSS